MKRTWIHIMLYVGCVALLLLQGHRIQQLQKAAAEDHAQEEAPAVRSVASRRNAGNLGFLCPAMATSNPTTPKQQAQKK